MASAFFTRRLGMTMGGSFVLGAGIELFMIKTGFCARRGVARSRGAVQRPLAAPAAPAARHGHNTSRARARAARADAIVTEKEAERYIERVEQHRDLVRRAHEQRDIAR